MGTRVTKLMYILMLFTCFLIAVAVVAFIFVTDNWSEPFAIVGSIIGYSTIAVLLMTLIMLRCAIPISCRFEFALAGIASILWFITTSLAVTSTLCAGFYLHYYTCQWYRVMVGTMGFVNGTLLCIFFAVLSILISRQLKHGNKDVWTNPLTTAILTVSGPPDLEISDRPDVRVDGHDPPRLIPAMPLMTTPSHMLLDPNRNMGQDMSIAEFCEAFGLQSSVLEKLKENAFDHARYLRYITMDNLTEMGFKLGEKAVLQEAVERWSISRV